MYTLAELGLTPADLAGLHRMHIVPEGRMTAVPEDPNLLLGVVTVRGWPYELHCRGSRNSFCARLCCYAQLRPLYTPRDWHPRPHAYDWRTLPVPTPGGHRTGLNVRLADGTPYVLGPTDDTLAVVTQGVDPFVADMLVNRRYVTWAGWRRGEVRWGRRCPARWARSRFAYYHGFAAERNALIRRLATHEGVPPDWCPGEVADLPMLTRRAARRLPPIEGRWAEQDGTGVYAAAPRRRRRAAVR